MNSLRQIPLHILMLAGLAGPLAAQEQAAPAAATAPAAKAAAATVAYSGLNVAAPNEESKTKAGVAIPDGVGVRVVVVDPQGPSAGKVEVGDVLTRLDDQVLVSSEQFRTLVRLRKAGEKVKLVAVREGEVKTLEVELAAKAAPERRVTATPPRGAVSPDSPGAGSPLSITVNGQQIDLGGMPGGAGTVTQVGPGHVVIIGPNHGLPPEIQKQLEEMRARGLPIPPLGGLGATPADPKQAQAQAHADAQAGATMRRESKSFSFSFGGPGATSTSSSVASDEHGTVSLEQKDGKKHAVIKDKDGNVTFDGDVTTDELRAKMPAEARDRLKLVEGSSFSIQGLKPGRKADGATEPEPPKKKRNPKEGA